MNLHTHKHPDQDQQARREALNERLKEILLQRMPEAGVFPTTVPGLNIGRHDIDQQRPPCFYRPSLGVVVQGVKKGIIGASSCTYRQGQCLVVGVDVPSSFHILEASVERPFLAIALELDPPLLAQLVAKIPPMAEDGAASLRGLFVEDAPPELLDALVRLLSLLDTPEQIEILAPIVIQEIHYRLLSGPQGRYLRQLNSYGSHGSQIARAVIWLRENYRDTFQVDALASKVHMATSTFHRYFKETTGLSPLQFHKQLRLYEAQRLMLSGEENASSAGSAVGYESATQFNREYKRLFGEPPRRDISSLRRVAAI
ncbi:MAG: AraC family transcriptional regulator [Phycisphaerales bacterium]|nr:AraC family transcriptional regulator [Phycisphaerales bacterium]